MEKGKIMNSNKVYQSSDKYLLRLPDGMRSRIKVEATKNFRSMSGELLFQLVKIYPAPDELAEASKK